jgi:hypothetical protein
VCCVVHRSLSPPPPRGAIRWWAVVGAAVSFSSCHSGEWRNWQTRWLQVPVAARSWGFKSPLAHPIIETYALVAALWRLVTKVRRGVVVTDWSRFAGQVRVWLRFMLDTVAPVAGRHF